VRVIIDAISIGSGGGQRYVDGLVPALIASRTDWNFLVLVKEAKFNCGTADGNPLIVRLPGVVCKFPIRLIAQQCAIPILAWMTRARVVLSLSDIGPIWSPVPVLATVANAFIYRALSQDVEYRLSKADLPFVDRIRTRGLAVISKLFLRRAKGLIFWTAASKREVERLIMKEVPSAVIHNGEPFRETASGLALGSRKKQILCVSTIVRYRNQLRLVCAFHELLKSDMRSKEFSLLLIGDVCDAQYASSIREFVKENQLQGYVRMLGNLPYAQVQDYYRESWALIFPSRVETYGFPVVEGLFNAIPMGVSDIPPFRELAGGAAIYFDPNSVDSIRAGMERLLWDDKLRQGLLEAAKEERQKYSWEVTGGRTARMIEKVLHFGGVERAGEPGGKQVA
jgi:glycosyltransferase involved in cell wall biosynthesis